MGETSWKDLPITGPPYKLTDQREQDKVSVQVMDAYVDEAGNTIKRPGLKWWADLPTTNVVDGLYWWSEQEWVVAVVGANVYVLTDSTGSLTVAGTLQPLPIGNRVSFATAPDGASVLMASGENIVVLDTTPVCTTVADADAPTTVRSLTVYDQYTIAQVEGTGTFVFDEVGSGGVTWRSQDVLSAESKPDRLMAVMGTLDGFELFGKQSTEFWINDGVTPFSRVRGLTFNKGLGARYSPALFGDTWMWLDEHRIVVRATLNKLEEVSDPIRKELQSLNIVEDAIGDIITPNGWPLYVLTFPSANRTFVYDLKQNHWLEWGNWYPQTATYRRFRGQSYCYAEKWNKHLVGDCTLGAIYELDSNTFTDSRTTEPDVEVDPDIIRSSRLTGFITHDTGNRKRCKRIRLRLKRGAANADVAAPIMQVRWREQGRAWTPTYSLDVSLGAVGQHEIFVEMTQCGTYRARQYEFIHSDATEWILMGGQELVEIMDR